jgi:hypothetical protein
VYLTFSEEQGGKVEITEVVVPTLNQPHVSLIPGDIPITGLGETPTPTNSIESIFGPARRSGTWGFDSKGRVAGYFVEIARPVICETNVVAISTNTFESDLPLNEMISFPGGMCITTNLSSNAVPSVVSNQTICFHDRMAVSTTVFASGSPFSQTNTFPDGTYCETLPVFTNIFAFANQTTCFQSNGTPTVTNIIPGAFPIDKTVTFLDGSYCITSPVFTNDFMGVEQRTCFVGIFPFSTNSFPSSNLVAGATFINGILCRTLPVVSTLGPNSTFTNQTICYSIGLDCTAALTNKVSFLGTVVPGKRLTLSCRASFGNFSLRGVPAVPLQDLSGSWYGRKTQNGFPANEFFTLTAIEDLPNAYLVDGGGPNYTYTNGLALASSQKKMAFGFTSLVGTNELSTRAVVGPLNLKKGQANTLGIELLDGVITPTNRANFQVNKRTTVP